MRSHLEPSLAAKQSGFAIPRNRSNQWIAILFCSPQKTMQLPYLGLGFMRFAISLPASSSAARNSNDFCKFNQNSGVVRR